MTEKATLTAERSTRSKGESSIDRPARELVIYRLQCARTANGLSHYYMYGDIAPEETLL